MLVCGLFSWLWEDLFFCLCLRHWLFSSFFSAGGSDRTLEFLHCDGISSGSQVVLFLGHSAGAVAPLFFHACACGISLCGFLEVFFVLSFFHPLAVSFLRLFLDSWLRLVSSS